MFHASATMSLQYLAPIALLSISNVFMTFA
jgi:uncharacterized protein (DUF486 family)